MLKDYENHTQPLSEKKKIAFSDGLDITVIILVVGLFVAIILAFLAEFMFDLKINWKEVGIDTGIVAACTVAIYLLLCSFAQRRGRKTERYGKAAERLQDMNREIIEHNLSDKVRDYCREWERKQLDSDRSAILNSAGITIEEYKEKYQALDKRELKKKFPNLTRLQLKIIGRAGRVRTAHYDENYLFANRRKSIGSHKSPSGGLTTRTLNAIDYIRTICTTVLTSLFSASILQEVIFNPSKETVIKLVVKLAVIVTFAALGMVGGYNFSTVKEVNEMNSKSDEMENFIRWCDNFQIKKDG